MVRDGKITLTLSALINCPDSLILQLLVQNFKLGIFFLGLNLSVMVVFLALRAFFVNSQKNCESSVSCCIAIYGEESTSQMLTKGCICLLSIYHVLGT